MRRHFRLCNYKLWPSCVTWKMIILSQRSYIRPIFARRKEQGDFYHLVRELELADNEYFCRYARFSPALLEDVLQLVGPLIQHSQIHFFTSQINLSSVFSIGFFSNGSRVGE